MENISDMDGEQGLFMLQYYQTGDCCATVVLPLKCRQLAAYNASIMGADLTFLLTCKKMRLWNEAAKLMHVQSFDFQGFH